MSSSMLPQTEHPATNKIAEKIATEINCRPQQVLATAALLDEGATVPFIARYRKEVTGGLDDIQLRLLDERLVYLREMEERRRTILASIEEQGKLTPALATAIHSAETKQRLEDLYLPYKPKRRSKAQIAREAGLAPLAAALLADPMRSPEAEAVRYLNAEAGFANVRSVLDGARQILMEQFSEDAGLLGALRNHLETHGFVKSTVVAGKESEAAKYQDYAAYMEAIQAIPSHRALALFRGRNEGMLQLALVLESELDQRVPNPCEERIARHFGIVDQGRPADKWLAETVRWSWRIKASPHLELELMNALRERAEAEAIRVFAANLHDLLLAAPAGKHATLGLDPGLRSGVKVAVVDATGKLLETATIYPHEPRRDWDSALHTLAVLARRHQVRLISIGNGTASRETDRLAADLIRQHPELHLVKVVVSEAGASVYSASEYASREFPELDVSLRGAVSIARRLQDPLAELVKIDPKSIGVGQYQHDVSQTRLARALNAVVEDCVNAVGVDVNTASASLLTRVSGLSPTLAANIVAHRDQHGAFPNRQALRAVPRLGDKTFELAAGFLRINESDNPLDRSAVHPEAYPLVERILAKVRKGIGEVIGDSQLLRALLPEQFIDQKFGLPTVRDILRELEKPGRDPRPEFRTANFREGVESVKDLQVGMILEGVVTNVANFGAFVDIGVHQDGLVHVSAIADRFVKDPRSVVKAGDVVKVKVLEVDLPRQRIALSMRLADDLPNAPKMARIPVSARAQERQRSQPEPTGAMASAFARLKR
ncbi:MAG: RNA-binding transcriptional accessory protein [Candidatus Accumulibacter cognatus]|uniref:RNA-binding transcriptional accessory protein n=2 Tax=Candidatus Accumulibacter cognatus TaxID=2954383 RepID=A0A7D5NBT8_9PROT|nr:RNA-binding transcriptional accessory protein [Accumulibacter sp.]QLH51615.1 MAG: RNA-binding transcriptional accessory protein [Candidatus Accumulibacter cognatus]